PDRLQRQGQRDARDHLEDDRRLRHLLPVARAPDADGKGRAGKLARASRRAQVRDRRHPDRRRNRHPAGRGEPGLALRRRLWALRDLDLSCRLGREEEGRGSARRGNHRRGREPLRRREGRRRGRGRRADRQGRVMTGPLLTRIAEALERLAPAPHAAPDLTAEAFVWHADPDRLVPVAEVARVDLPLLVGIDRARDTLLANTAQFAQGLPANNALLWGARGMGKSSLVKAVHAAVRAQGTDLKIVELSREDLSSIGRLLALLRAARDHRFILFCDDLSFSHDDQHYKALKAVLDGGIEGRPENVLFYATSNRRHLMPRDMIENERSSAINPSEAVEE